MEKTERLNMIVFAWQKEILNAETIREARNVFSEAKREVIKYCDDQDICEYTKSDAIEDLCCAYGSYFEERTEEEKSLVRLMIAMYNYHKEYYVFIDKMKEYGVLFEFTGREYGIVTFTTANAVGGHIWRFEINESGTWRTPMFDDRGHMYVD